MAEPGAPPAFSCQECGTSWPEQRLEGLCPVCLLNETSLPGVDAGAPAGSGPALLLLPGYRVTREIARGGMGIIYEAQQIHPSRSVAIKMLLPHLMEAPDMRERFRREAQSMAGLEHAGILPIYEVGDHNGLPFFSMKLAAGGTLSHQSGRFAGDWKGIAHLLVDLAEALQMAHIHGVLHRDLKPGNILFDERSRPYLSDFGIAKQLTGDPAHLDLTRPTMMLGTPNYLAPEWASGQAHSPTTAADLYGLGAILYQLLTGDPPHQADHLTTLLRKIADDPVIPPRRINPAVPRDLEVICLKTLSKSPDDRYTSAHDLAADLRLWLAGRPILARAASPLEKMWRWAGRNPLASTLAAALAVSLTAGGIVLWKSLQSSRHNLHDALIAQSRALRQTGQLGHRSQAVGSLDQAVQLFPSEAGRVELTSALAMTDLKEKAIISTGSAERPTADASLDRYTWIGPDGLVSVRRLGNPALVSQLPDSIRHPEFSSLSPDGRFLVVRPGKKDPACLWDCQQQTLCQQDLPGSYFTFSRDGRTLASSREDGTLTLIDPLSGAVTARFPTGIPKVRPYAFSPEGDRLIIGQFQSSKFAVLNCQDGSLLPHDENPPAAKVRCAIWRPDGKGFFIGTESFTIYEWSMGNTLPRSYNGHQGNILALAVHPDGEWLLSQSQDGTSRLWATSTTQTLAQLPYFGAEARFSPDGSQILCEDRTAQQFHLLELVPSSICRSLSVPHPDPQQTGTRGCWAITFSPDGGLLSAGDTAGLFHFDSFTGRLLGRQSLGFCWSLSWARDGSALYTASASGLQRWPATALPGQPSLHSFLPPETWEQESRDPTQPNHTINHLAVSADLSTVALAYEKEVGLFRAPDGRRLGHLPGTDLPLDAMALNANATLAASSMKERPGIPVWDTVHRLRLAILPSAQPEATLLFHPDGAHLYCGDFESISCWEARTSTLLWRLPCPVRSSVWVQMALTPDGSLLAANLTPETLTLIQPLTGKPITGLRHPSPNPIASIAFSPDQSRLAVLCYGHLIQLWDLRQLRGELVQRHLDWPHPPLPPAVTGLVWKP